MADKYDRQIERLQTVPDEEFEKTVLEEWRGGKDLFDFVPYCDGCLTMLRNGAVAPKTALQEEIADDTLLPTGPEEITKENLPRFAYWQRELRRRKAKT